jgi:hypothetical protein
MAYKRKRSVSPSRANKSTAYEMDRMRHGHPDSDDELMQDVIDIEKRMHLDSNPGTSADNIHTNPHPGTSTDTNTGKIF